MIPFLLLALGLLLIYTEFFLPGGILGTLGGIVLLSGVVVFAIQYESPLLTILFIFLTLACVFVLFTLTLKQIPKAKPEHSIYSGADQEGYVASTYDKSAVGKIATVVSDLKPGGHVVIEGKKYPAISLSGYIVKGMTVIVTGGQGDTLTVKLYKQGEAP